MEGSSNLLANKRKSCNMLNATLRRKQPMRACRRRATELNAGKFKRVVIPTSACPDRSIGNKILSLPKELMFNILLLFPADVLYNVMRILFLSPDAYYADTSTSAVTVERINFQFSGEVWSSCDGLVLFSDPKDLKILHIVNPITKQQVTLPPFVPGYFGYYFVLARACSTGEYKVVATYISTDYNVFHCVILTVGKDLTWRKVDIQHISVDQQRALMNRPRSAGGYIFWIMCHCTNLLTLDVEAEVLRDFPPVPKPLFRCNIFYAEIGNSLGCMFWHYDTLVFEVLVLSDPRSGKWENLYKFNLEGKRHMIIAWVNNGEVLVFSTLIAPGTNYVAHNVKTGETCSFGIYKEKFNPLWLVHVNSLVSLEP